MLCIVLLQCLTVKKKTNKKPRLLANHTQGFLELRLDSKSRTNDPIQCISMNMASSMVFNVVCVSSWIGASLLLPLLLIRDT